MKIRVIWPGKTKEQFITEGVNKYLKLLRPYAEISVLELREEKGNDISKMLKKEGERILKLQVPYTLLDEKGDLMTSGEFAGYIAEHIPPVNFVLGGAYGVSEDVKKTAQKKLSLSKMTFTHEMSRLFFLEQLYRAFTIIHKRGYHH
ncbi:MAG: 23S rRNA (pseudouridine(1915)-N(3))-methyltransferase RlmH [Nitrospiraceae bacterium]|jgi:23S rRNA (pseudouridine1915-N3)-methyltransferase|nr:MAG: 23S rRNA (pseudouridine(1915)-N(3))-methyltransferase RlmH [Nitrospiraceae bacterium]